jgi:Zn-dependent M16 (insulinase) family peptidase
MTFKISKHFSLSKTERLKSKNTVVYFYEHIKTGAKIIYLKNKNQNSSFGTFFKTPANNDKGTTHILEHLVFSGSKNFPKGDVLEYIKDNSLASFFNASTYTDATLYHFASSFEKDYLNVLDMYLDFMYFPNLEDKMFKREAFFYTKNKDEFNFNGIVFNEMKDNLLTLNSKITNTVKEMFKPGPYTYESGGNPLDIVDLTNDEIKEYHKKYYHPSNSYTIIFGDINPKKVFQKLDEVYSHFEKLDGFNFPQPEPTFENKKIEVAYQSSDTKDVGNFTKYYLFKDITTEEDFVSLKSGIVALFRFDFSPVTKDLNESKLLISFSTGLDGKLNYPVLYVSCQGVKKDDIEKLELLLDTSIKKHIKNIPNEIKEIILKKHELKYKELEFSENQGINESNKILEKWKNNLDPLIENRGLKTLDIYKKVLSGKKLEKFLEKKFSEIQTLSVRFSPSKNLLENYNQEISRKLQEKLKCLDLNLLSKEIDDFEKEDEEKKESFKYKNYKKLTTKDLKLKEYEFPVSIKDSIYYVEVPSEDIFRLKLNFDISQIEPSKFFYLETYLELISKTGTKNNNYIEFGKLTSRSIPFFHIHSRFVKDYISDNYNFYAVFNFIFLLTDKDKVLDLILEFKNDIYFEKDWVLFCLREKLEEIEQTMVQKPVRFGLLLAKSLISPDNYYSYQTESLPHYERLKDIVLNFDEKFEDFKEELLKIHKYIFSQNCLTYYATSKKYLSEGHDFVKKYCDKLDIKVVTKDKIENFSYPEYESNYKNSSSENYYHFTSNSESNFVIVTYKYADVERDKRELMHTIELYLERYLWDKIRVKGKAYGFNQEYTYSSNSTRFMSIRDPNIDLTIDTFSNYKKNYDISKFKKKDFDKLKLQELSKYKLIMTNSILYSYTFNNFLSNRDFDHRKRILSRLKELSFVEYKNLFELLKNVMKKFVVVVATEKNLSKSKHKFITKKFN